MAVVKCKECKKPVSTEAQACPHCGAPAPAQRPPEPRAPIYKRGWVKALAVVVGLWALGQAVGRDDGGSASDYPSAEHQENIDRILEERRANPPPAAEEKPGRHWLQSSETSPIDDSRNVFLRSVAERAIPNPYGGTERPQLWLRCKENTTAAIITWDVYLGIDQTRMITRIDDESAQERTWSISTNYESVGRWSGGSAIPFIQSLFGHEKLYARITPYGENPVETTFDVSGLEERIGPLREACNW